MNHHTMKTNETDTTTATATQSTKSTVLLSIDKIRPNPKLTATAIRWAVKLRTLQRRRSVPIE